MIIDFHTHTFPDKIASAVIEKLEENGGIYSFGKATASGLVESNKICGIDYSVVLPVITNPDKTEKINDISISLNGKDGLIYFGGIHPDSADIKNQLKKLADNGIKGIKIHPVYQRTDIDDIRFLRIFDICGELGLFVLSHCGNDVGYPAEKRATPKQIKSVLSQVGKFNFIAAHMGGWKQWNEVIEELNGREIYIDTAVSLSEMKFKNPDNNLWDKGFVDENMLCKFISAFGDDKILFGTDSPWSDRKTEIEIIKGYSFSDKIKNKILCDNAKKILLI